MRERALSAAMIASPCNALPCRCQTPSGANSASHVVVAPLIEIVEKARQRARAIPFDGARDFAADGRTHRQAGIALSRLTRSSAPRTSSPTSEPTAIT